MRIEPMFVHSTAVLLKAPADTLKTLDAEVKQLTGIHFRRVNRFILLAVCGAHQCAAGHAPGPGTAVWVTTENGTVGDTEKTLDQLFNQRTYPKPYNFINTMSNTAAFYIAQSLRLQSRNVTLACTDFAFERGLALARSDLRRGTTDGALIGGVDEAVFSETRLRNRFGNRLVDGSAWLYITREQRGALGEIMDVRSFGSGERALAWLRHKELPGDALLAFNVRVPPMEQARWRALLPGAALFDYITAHGYFDSATSAGIGLFFQNFKNKICVHVAKDNYGSYVLLTARVY
jgi:hypothetical protein